MNQFFVKWETLKVILFKSEFEASNRTFLKYGFNKCVMEVEV